MKWLHFKMTGKNTGTMLLVLFLILATTGLAKGGDQLFSSARKESADSLKIKHYIALADSFLKKGGRTGFDIVSLYIDSALKVSQNLPGKVTGELNFFIARYNYARGDYSGVEEKLQLAEKSALENNNFPLLADVYLFRGIYFQRIGFLREGRESFEKSIQVARKEKVGEIIPYGYEGIANILIAAGDSAGYRKYVNEMIRSAFAESDTIVALSGLLRLGNSYVEGDRDPVKADSVLRECLRISLLSKNTYYSGFSSANLGWNFYLLGNLDSAQYYYKQSINFSIPDGHESITANSLGNLGTIARDKGYFETAKTFYKRALEVALKLRDWYTLSWVNNDLHRLYLMLGDTARAYSSFVLFKQYNDSLLLKRSSQGLTDARIRYEADNHKKEISLLSEKLRNNRLMNLLFSGLLILVITIGLFTISIYRMSTRKRMSELNEKLAEIKQANLRQQMNPHFIFNTLNSIQYFMYQHDKLATNVYMTKFSNLIRKVLDNSQHTYISLSDELDALSLYLELESMRFRDKFEYRIEVDEEIDTALYKIPTMLLQPYVENSICHGLMPLDKKGCIKIEITHKGNHLLCAIEDNGIGREAGMENKKAKGGNHASLGTQITASRIDLVNSAHGTNLKTVFIDLKDHKGEPAGTRVEIQIPILT